MMYSKTHRNCYNIYIYAHDFWIAVSIIKGLYWVYKAEEKNIMFVNVKDANRGIRIIMDHGCRVFTDESQLYEIGVKHENTHYQRIKDKFRGLFR